MFTLEDRQELCELFENLKTSVESTLDNDKVLPSSITFNGENVGMTLQLRKFHKERPEDQRLVEGKSVSVSRAPHEDE